MSWSNGLHPQLRRHFEALFSLAQRADPGARVTSAYRSTAEQTRLYRNFVAGRSKYPVAPPGASWHEFGRAIDIIARPEVLRWLGGLWKHAGGRWGGDFNDDIHFDA